MVQQDIRMGIYEDRFMSIERRLEYLESALGRNGYDQTLIRPDEVISDGSDSRSGPVVNEEKGLEFKVGRVGLAWLGNIVLLFAIVFFTEYIIALRHAFLSLFIGIFSAGFVLLVSIYLKKTNPNLSFMLWINGQIILFYEILRMHFYSANPLISNKLIIIGILLVITGIQIYSAIKIKSQTLGFLSVVFVLITALLSDSTHFLLPLTTLTAIGTVYWFTRYDWQVLLFTSIFLCYATFFLWLFGNPVTGHPMQIITNHQYGFFYLFALGGCFSSLPLFRKSDESLDELLIVATLINGILFTLLLTFFSIRFFEKNYVNVFSIITICCLAYSIFLKSASDWKYASAFYALYGFLAMSISLYGMVGFPRVYLLLSVQSLVVVTLALWFRNRLIIVMNSLLFLSILLVYLLGSKPVDAVNFSLALVPLISARIINWQKARLSIKTDLIRNLYLIEGFIMVMFALYHGLPRHFVTLSWTLAALLYFLLSFLLKNIKYRYMAIGTMICAAIYLFLVDLARIEVIYRVLALLFLAVVSIGISIYYSNRIKRSVH